MPSTKAPSAAQWTELPAVDVRNLAKGYDHVGPQLHFTDVWGEASFAAYSLKSLPEGSLSLKNEAKLMLFFKSTADEEKNVYQAHCWSIPV